MKTTNDLWNLLLMFINPAENYRRFKEDNPFLKPLTFVVGLIQTLKSITGLVFLSPFKLYFWAIEKK